MFCSKHVDVKRHSVYFTEIKTFAVSSVVSNLLASQIGEFFLPHPVLVTDTPMRMFHIKVKFCTNRDVPVPGVRR